MRKPWVFKCVSLTAAMTHRGISLCADFWFLCCVPLNLQREREKCACSVEYFVMLLFSWDCVALELAESALLSVCSVSYSGCRGSVHCGAPEVFPREEGTISPCGEGAVGLRCLC